MNRKTKKLLNWLLGAVMLVAVYMSSGADGLQDIFAPQNDYAKVSTGIYDLALTIIDVGQADSILLESGDKAMLIDAGNSDNYDEIDKVLKEKGIKSLDAALATHSHADHIGAMADILAQYKPKNYYLSDSPTDTYTYKKTMTFAQEFAGDVSVLSVGDSFMLGEAKVTVLSPPKDHDFKELNDTSIVVLVEQGEFSAILTGDATIEAEKIMAQNSLAPVDVLKVGHHGSYTSSGKDFLSKLMPKYTAISLGQDNQYGFPHEITIKSLREIGAQIYRTDLNGNISFEYLDGNISVICQK